MSIIAVYVSTCHPILSSPSLFFTSFDPDFSNSTCWIYPIFNTLPFHLFTTEKIPTTTSFHEPKVQVFVHNDTSTPLRSTHTIVDPTHLVWEPNLSYFYRVFNGWSVSLFGILFLLHIFVRLIFPRFQLCTD